MDKKDKKGKKNNKVKKDLKVKRIGFLKRYKLSRYKLRKYKLKEKDDELGYPDGIYQKLFKICYIHPIGIFAGIYYGSPLATILSIMLSLTSINYWRYPLITSIRRTIDMIVAFTAISYHIYLSLRVFFAKDCQARCPSLSGILRQFFLLKYLRLHQKEIHEEQHND